MINIEFGKIKEKEIEIGLGKVYENDHSKLINLDYERSGHRGFQKELIAGENITIKNNVISAHVEGGSGTNNYNELSNLPRLNGTEIKGNINLKTINGNSIIGTGNIEIDGSNNYEDLSNKPRINNNELIGNKSYSELGIEDINNKVTSISSLSTDDEYPSAKCVYDLIGNIENLLENLDTGDGV